MSLTLPKRLFNITTLSTVMCVDVADDIKKKGYVAISHVWGDQAPYPASMFGIVGVNWDIPLSNPDKISRLADAMMEYDKEYCWFDVLCMPQDKQNEINLEIPFMGDYYAGADMTLVLSDTEYKISKNFPKWCDVILDIMESERNPTMEEELYIRKNGSELDNFNKDPWRERVWTFQEAVLSKEIILVGYNGTYINLLHISKITSWIIRENIHYASSFMSSVQSLYNIGSLAKDHKNGTLDLTTVLTESSRRNCYRMHDRFYGIFGVLGYRDFIVDYDIDINELNKYVVQYAYSKGDISWIGVGGNSGVNFIQPMYKYFAGGSRWEVLGSNDGYITVKDNHLHTRMIHLGTISRCEKCNSTKITDSEIRRVISVCASWEFSNFDIMDAMSDYSYKDEKYVHMMTEYFGYFATGVSFKDITKILLPQNLENILGKTHTHENFSNMSKQITGVFTMMMFGFSGTEYVVELKGLRKKYLAMISGDANIGDKVMIPMVTDGLNRRLGIVVSGSGKRKGICYMTPKAVLESSLQFISQKFPL